ncbi:MAG: tyrosine-protein phosphatase [Ilumatobacteraceae bacterium]
MSTSPDASPRSLLEGATNFRDIGGYATADGHAVRTGMVYRSGALHALTDADVERLRAMDVRTAFDLRSEAEQAAEPLAPPFVRPISVPLTRSEVSREISAFPDGYSYLRTRYDEILFELASTVGSILVTVARDDCLPAVIHGAAGKDRTGVVIAVLLLALGVDDATVLDDYELTSQYEAAQRVREIAGKLEGSGLPPALVAGLLGTHRSALSGALDEARHRFGSIEGYLITAGVSPDHLDALRSRLTV